MTDSILPGSSFYFSHGFFHIRIPINTPPIGTFHFTTKTKNPTYIEPYSFPAIRGDNIIYTFTKTLRRAPTAAEGVIATPEAVAAANARAKRLNCTIIGKVSVEIA